MVITMKKFISVVAALSILGTTVYADGEASLSITQIDIVDYLIYGGLALLLLGVIFILLSLFLKSSAKSISDDGFDISDNDNIGDDTDVENVEYNNDSEDFENDGGFVDNDLGENDDADNSSENFDTDDNSESESIDTPSEKPDNIDDISSEGESDTEATTDRSADDEIIDSSVEEQSLPHIRLTLTGMNNPDLKMIEFTESATIGRRSANDLMISDNAVSGVHCRLTYDGDVVCIEDLNSTNGTMLNGTSVTNSEIKSGDILIIGKQQYKITIS